MTRNLKTAALAVAVLLIAGVLLFNRDQLFAGQKGGPVIEAVSPEIVCMVNDEVMNKEQIPVEFEGKTYYGCCEGCVTTLKTERAARFSLDPLTGREVDKAAAFITEGPGGAALYFESRETAQRYHVKESVTR